MVAVGATDDALCRDGPSDVVYNSARDKFLVVWEETGAYARHVVVNGTIRSRLQSVSIDFSPF